MNRPQLKCGENKGSLPVATIRAMREGRLRCRDCDEYCKSDKAIKGRGLRCPACGGILDREQSLPEA